MPDLVFQQVRAPERLKIAAGEFDPVNTGCLLAIAAEHKNNAYGAYLERLAAEVS